MDKDPDPWENAAPSENVPIPGLAPYPAQNLSGLLDADNAVAGLTIKPLLFSAQALTTVYCETIRDKDVTDDSAKLWQYIAHEIGHATINHNGAQLSEGTEHAEGALMIQGADLQNLPVMQRFSAATIVRFRSVKKW